jgi:hypothetical protein
MYVRDGTAVVGQFSSPPGGLGGGGLGEDVCVLAAESRTASMAIAAAKTSAGFMAS